MYTKTLLRRIKLKRKKLLTLLIGICLILALVALPLMTACAPEEEEEKTLKIGCIMPFTGAYGFYGWVLRPPMEKYAEILNERGGVKIGKDTYMIEFVFVDDEIDPGKGPACAQELISKGCVANVGRFSDAPAINGVLQPAKLFDVGEIKPGYDITDWPYFIGGYDGVYNGVYALNGIVEKIPEVSHIGYLCYDWQSAQAEMLIELCLEPGTVISQRGIDFPTEIVPYGSTDFTTQLTKLKAAGCQLVNCSFGPGDYALAVKQAADLGYQCDWYNGGTMTDLEEFIAIAGYDNCQASKVMCNWPCPWTLPEGQVDPEMVDLSLEIMRRWAIDLGRPTTVEAYQGMYMGQFDWGVGQAAVLLDFFQRAGTIDPDAVMEIVPGGMVTDFTGTWQMGGEVSWGAPVIKPGINQVGVVEGWKMVPFCVNPGSSLP